MKNHYKTVWDLYHDLNEYWGDSTKSNNFFGYLVSKIPWDFCEEDDGFFYFSIVIDKLECSLCLKSFDPFDYESGKSPTFVIYDNDQIIRMTFGTGTVDERMTVLSLALPS